MDLAWIPVVAVAYTLLAGVQIVDRFILREAISDPIAYVFTISLATAVILPAAFFVFVWPGMIVFLLALLSGFLFIASLVPFFSALKAGEASRIIPAEGGLVTIFIFTLAAIFLGEGLAFIDIIAFGLLFLGYILVTIKGHVRYLWKTIDWRIVISAFLLAISYVLRRAIYPAGNSNFEGFFSVFLLLALGMTLSGLLLLIPASTRRRIFAARKQANTRNLGLVAGNQAGGAISGFLINYAISIGPVAFVQAAQGIQYIAIFILSVLLANKFPQYFGEVFTKRTVGLKLSGTISIAAGLAVLILA